jgi:hypothetical protein
MPINVICPGCHARFSVGDQFAGRTGPCPKCKAPIQIPAKSDEVVIHEPASEAGAKDAKGRNVLKPIKRRETKFSLNVALIVGAAALFAFALAFILGRQTLPEGTKTIILVVGALLLGPPLAFAGYSFLRDDEQGAFVGKDLWIRALATGAAYAFFWGIYWFVGRQIFGADDYNDNVLELFEVGILAGLMIGLGTFTAVIAFDFDPISAFFHYALFFGATVLLRVTMGLALLPGVGGDAAPPPSPTAKPPQQPQFMWRAPDEPNGPRPLTGLLDAPSQYFALHHSA